MLLNQGTCLKLGTTDTAEDKCKPATTDPIHPIADQIGLGGKICVCDEGYYVDTLTAKDCTIRTDAGATTQVGMWVRGSLMILSSGAAVKNPFNSSIECIVPGEYLDVITFAYASTTTYAPICNLESTTACTGRLFTYNGKIYCGCPVGKIVMEISPATPVSDPAFKCEE